MQYDYGGASDVDLIPVDKLTLPEPKLHGPSNGPTSRESESNWFDMYESVSVESK